MVQFRLQPLQLADFPVAGLFRHPQAALERGAPGLRGGEKGLSLASLLVDPLQIPFPFVDLFIEFIGQDRAGAYRESHHEQKSGGEPNEARQVRERHQIHRRKRRR